MLRLILDYVSIYVFKNITQGKIMTIYLIIYDLNPEKFLKIILKSIHRSKKCNLKKSLKTYGFNDFKWDFYIIN